MNNRKGKLDKLLAIVLCLVMAFTSVAAVAEESSQAVAATMAPTESAQPAAATDAPVTTEAPAAVHIEGCADGCTLEGCLCTCHAAAPTSVIVTEPGSTEPGPTEPGPTEPGPTEPGPTEPGPTEPGPTEPGPTEPGSTEPGSTEPGSTEPGPTAPGPTEPGPTEPGPTEPGPTEPGPTEPGPTEPGPTEPGPTEPGPIEPGPTEPGPTEPGPTEPGSTEPGPTEPGSTESDTADSSKIPGETDDQLGADPVSYTVSFNLGVDAEQAGIAAPAPITVNEDGTVTLPENPVWTDEDGEPVKLFGGWYLDPEFTSPFDPSATAITSALTLYAKWDAPLENDIMTYADVEEDINELRISKKFVGLTQEQINTLTDFSIEVKNSSGELIGTLRLAGATPTPAADGIYYHWKINNVGAGTYNVQEFGYGSIANYSVTSSGTGSVTIEAADVTIRPEGDGVYEPGNDPNFTVTIDTTQNFLLAGNTTSGEIVILCTKEPTASEKLKIQDYIRSLKQGFGNKLDTDFHYYVVGDLVAGQSFTIRGQQVDFNLDLNDPGKGTFTFGASCQWTKVALAAYTPPVVQIGDIAITNTYTPLTRPVSITKTVSGNMGDHSKPFAFTVTCDQPMGPATNGEYTLSVDLKTAEFSLAHGGSVTLNEVRRGASLTITEDSDGYVMTVKLGDDSPDEVNGSYSFIVPSDGDTVIAVTVNNEKEVTIDTGILLDSLPYVIILGLVAAAVVLVVLKKRRYRDDY